LSRVGHLIYLTRAAYSESSPLLSASCMVSALSRADRILCFTPAKSRRFGLLTFGTMIPSDDNYVCPDADSRDQFGLPSLDIRIRFEPAVRQNVAQAQRRLVEIFAAAGIRATISCTD